MITAITGRPINLAQLAGELSDPPTPLSMRDDGTEREITCHDEAVTQAQLDAAIDAHVPAPPPPSDAVIVANLRARLTTAEQTIDQIIIDALMGDFPPL